MNMVKLYSGSKKDTLPIAVHRLVAMMFIPNPKNKKEVHHIDHNHQNNQASNLMWVTDEENIRFEYIDGIEHSKPDQYGENNPSNKYSEEQIHDVCKLLDQNKTPKEIGLITGIPRITVSMIKAGEQWTQISSQYNIPKPKENYDWSAYKPHIKKYLIQGYTLHQICDLLRPPTVNKECFRSVVKNAKKRFLQGKL